MKSLKQIIIESLLKQLEVLAGSDVLHYERVSEIYQKILLIVTSEESVQIDIKHAEELFKKCEDIIKNYEIKKVKETFKKRIK